MREHTRLSCEPLESRAVPAYLYYNAAEMCLTYTGDEDVANDVLITITWQQGLMTDISITASGPIYHDQPGVFFEDSGASYNWLYSAQIVGIGVSGGGLSDSLRIIGSGRSPYATVAIVVYAGAGNDQIETAYGPDLIHGEAGSDTIIGSGGSDLIYGDSNMAGAGADLIYGDKDAALNPGADGDDTVYGGFGDDRISGGRGRDLLVGEDGNDTIYGAFGTGSDSLDGDDTLAGGSGNDLLFGSDGHDSIYGDDGDDSLYGGAGNDSLFGGMGRDSLEGEQGDDQLALGRDPSVPGEGDGVEDIALGGPGIDGFTEVDLNSLDQITQD